MPSVPKSTKNPSRQTTRRVCRRPAPKRPSSADDSETTGTVPKGRSRRTPKNRGSRFGNQSIVTPQSQSQNSVVLQTRPGGIKLPRSTTNLNASPLKGALDVLGPVLGDSSLASGNVVPVDQTPWFMATFHLFFESRRDSDSTTVTQQQSRSPGLEWIMHAIMQIRKVSPGVDIPHVAKGMLIATLANGSNPGLNSVLFHPVVQQHYLNTIDVPGDGNCGFRVLIECLHDLGRTPTEQMGLDMSRKARRGPFLQQMIRSELGLFFWTYRAHYMESNMTFHFDGPSYAVYCALSQPASSASDSGHYFSTPLHPQLFADRYQISVLLCRSPSATYLELWTPTRSPAQFLDPRSRHNNTIEEVMNNQDIKLSGIYTVDSHAQFLTLQDSWQFRAWIIRQVYLPVGQTKVLWRRWQYVNRVYTDHS